MKSDSSTSDHTQSCQRQGGTESFSSLPSEGILRQLDTPARSKKRRRASLGGLDGSISPRMTKSKSRSASLDDQPQSVDILKVLNKILSDKDAQSDSSVDVEPAPKRRCSLEAVAETKPTSLLSEPPAFLPSSSPDSGISYKAVSDVSSISGDSVHSAITDSGQHSDVSYKPVDTDSTNDVSPASDEGSLQIVSSPETDTDISYRTVDTDSNLSHDSEESSAKTSSKSSLQTRNGSCAHSAAGSSSEGTSHDRPVLVDDDDVQRSTSCDKSSYPVVVTISSSSEPESPSEVTEANASLQTEAPCSTSNESTLLAVQVSSATPVTFKNDWPPADTRACSRSRSPTPSLTALSPDYRPTSTCSSSSDSSDESPSVDVPQSDDAAKSNARQEGWVCSLPPVELHGGPSEWIFLRSRSHYCPSPISPHPCRFFEWWIGWSNGL